MGKRSLPVESHTIEDINGDVSRAANETQDSSVVLDDSAGLPFWLANPVLIESASDPTPITELDFGLSEKTLKALSKNGITSLFPVQMATIPVLLRQKQKSSSGSSSLFRSWGSGDLCVAAPTGSGKTLSFVLPILEQLRDRVVTRLRAIVILPTRDLATQVKETFDAFMVGTDLKIALSTGHSPFLEEQQKLVKPKYSSLASLSNSLLSQLLDDDDDCDDDESEPERSLPATLLEDQSKIDILVCTPGRLMDHLEGTKGFTLKDLEILVIDEADRLLSQSYQNWLPNLLQRIRLDQQQTIDNDNDNNSITRKWLFSATLTRNPEKLGSLCLNDPTFIHVTGAGGERFSIPKTLKVIS